MLAICNIHKEQSGLRGGVSFLEIVFVGECEVFVCLEFVEIFFFLGRKAHRSANVVSFL